MASRSLSAASCGQKLFLLLSWLLLSEAFFFFKLSNCPLLALCSPAFAPSPPFWFKLLYNDFTFLESCKCPQVSLAYSSPEPAEELLVQYEMKKAFHKKCEDFESAGLAAVRAPPISFPFWQWSLHWIHLSWSGGNCSCRPQTTVLLKQFNFFLSYPDIFRLLGSSSCVIIGNFCGFHGVIQDSCYSSKHDRKYVRIERDHLLLWHVIYWRDSCSPGLSPYVHTWAHWSSNTRGYRIMTASQEEIQLNACSYDLKLCLYVGLHLFPLQVILSMSKVCMCVYVCKF